MSKFIALYLPQFHPIEENNSWYGAGYTEWRNVVSAKKLFIGHYQPHIPADLGFYDLRLKQTVLDQVKLANDYKIDGFAYWHYWFGNGKELLEKPFKQLVNDKSINIEFSLAWANHTWEKKQWSDKGKNLILVTQQYLGKEDYVNHFYAYLEAFRDSRYTRIDDKLLFLIYNPLASSEIEVFINTWRELAKKEGLKDFYFVGHDTNGMHQKEILKMGFDGIYDDRMLDINNHQSFIKKAFKKIKRAVFDYPSVFEYKDAIKYMVTSESIKEDIIPTIVPNWDHSPRSGGKGIILNNCEPKYFETLVGKAINNIEKKQETKRIVLIKSWNEWGEGNHLEPDLKFGKGYLEAIKRVREKYKV